MRYLNDFQRFVFKIYDSDIYDSKIPRTHGNIIPLL